MSAYLLHQGAGVQCLHGADASPQTTFQRVKVDKKNVVTQADVYTISNCQYQIQGAPSPCTTAQWTSAATRVKAGGNPVLLQDSQASCIPNGTGVNIGSTQTRVKGA